MGMFDIFQGPYGQNPVEPGLQRQRIVPAHVLEVCMDTESKMYENPADIGKIRYRDVGNLTPFRSRIEDEITTEAWPMDRALGRYPLPGEQVMVFEAFGDVKLPSANALQRISFYAFNVNTNHIITSNQTPFIISNVDTISKSRVATSIATKRFKNKLIDEAVYRDGDEVKIYPQIQPYEGDFILQGRFGASVRLGSTSVDHTTNEWSDNGGAAGNPIMIVSANRTNSSTPIMEQVNNNDSTIYLCSSQAIPIEISTSKKLRTHLHRYDLNSIDGDLFSTVSDITSCFKNKIGVCSVFWIAIYNSISFSIVPS